MKIELEIKETFRSGLKINPIIEHLSKFTIFKEEDIIKAFKKGGKSSSEIYSNLIKFHKKSNEI